LSFGDQEGGFFLVGFILTLPVLEQVLF